MYATMMGCGRGWGGALALLVLCGAGVASGQAFGPLPAPEAALPAVPHAHGTERGASADGERPHGGVAAAGREVSGRGSAAEAGRGSAGRGRAQRGFPFIEKKARLQPGDPKVDINTAPVSLLVKLPGVGRKRAEQIVALREKRPFRRVLELRRVRGIGRKTMQRLLPLVTLTAPKATAKLGKQPAKKVAKKLLRRPAKKPAAPPRRAKLVVGKVKVRVARAAAAPPAGP